MTLKYFIQFQGSARAQLMVILILLIIVTGLLIYSIWFKSVVLYIDNEQLQFLKEGLK